MGLERINCDSVMRTLLLFMLEKASLTERNKEICLNFLLDLVLFPMVLILVINSFVLFLSFSKLQVSRSIGDVYLKKPEFNRDPIFQQFGNPVPLKRAVMTAEPSILTRELKPQDLFLIFASDGLWEQLTDEAAVEIVSKNPRAVSYRELPFMSFTKHKLQTHSNISLTPSGNCKEISSCSPTRSSKETGDEIHRLKEDRKGDSASFPRRHYCHRRLSRPQHKLTHPWS